MLAYTLKRILLMLPTLFGVVLLTFVVTQFVPGGPVEQMMAQLQDRSSGGESASAGASSASTATGYRGSQGAFGRCSKRMRDLIWERVFININLCGI
jgi:microcin C transport system permease protein